MPRWLDLREPEERDAMNGEPGCMAAPDKRIHHAFQTTKLRGCCAANDTHAVTRVAL